MVCHYLQWPYVLFMLYQFMIHFFPLRLYNVSLNDSVLFKLSPSPFSGGEREDGVLLGQVTNLDEVCRLALQNTPPTPLPNPLACLALLYVKLLLSVYTHFVLLRLVFSNSTSAHPVWLPRDQSQRRYKIYKDSMKFLTFIVTLTLQTTIQFLHQTLQLMVMYHPIKFACKKIRRSVDVVESHI